MTAQGPAYHAAVRRLWISRATRLGGIAAFFGLTWVPYVQHNNFLFGWALTSSLVGLSMNVLVGYAGQISLAQAVLFGGGAFAMGNLVTAQGVPWLVSLPVAALATAALALIIGFPALRVRGLNLAILTLGFQFVMQRAILRSDVLTDGEASIDIDPPTLLGGITLEGIALLRFIMLMLVVVWVVDRNLTRSRAGRAFFALRQDEQVAASFGIPVARYKLLAFAISGFYAGLAGALFGTLLNEVTAESFDFQYSIEFLVFAVLGGLGSRAGTAIGAAFPVIFRRVLDFLQNTGQVLGGILLLVTLLRYRGGMAAQGRELRHVAVLLARRGFVYLMGFIASIAAAITAGVVAQAAIGAALTGTGLRTFRVGANTIDIFTAFPRVAVGLLIAAIVFQVLVQRLVRAAHVGTASHTVADVGPAAAPLQTAVKFRRPAVSRPTRAPLLEVEGLTKRFGGVRALDGVGLEVRAGELIGIMGPNGSGKTTLLNCVSGFLRPNEGDIRFKGRSILGLQPHERAALGLGRTFQNIGLVKQETVFDNFVIAQHLVCGYGPMEGLLRTGGVVDEERRLAQRAHAAIEMLGLKDIVDEPVHSLPHGRAKLVELGCALVTGPELLLLDEPAAGVSPQEADALGETLKRIAESFGVTILMIEHHVPLMLSTCDYIYVLNFGQLLTHGEPADVARHPDVIAAYLGTAGKEAGDVVASRH